MAEMVVRGVGLRRTLMAYELLAQLRPGDRLSLVGWRGQFQFTPSHPWVAAGWTRRHHSTIT